MMKSIKAEVGKISVEVTRRTDNSLFCTLEKWCGQYFDRFTIEESEAEAMSNMFKMLKGSTL